MPGIPWGLCLELFEFCRPCLYVSIAVAFEPEALSVKDR